MIKKENKAFIRNVWKLVFRTLLLAVSIYLIITDVEKLDFTAVFHQGFGAGFLVVVWIMLAFEMLSRIIPNRRIEIGARKHFSCSYSAARFTENGMMDMGDLRKRLNKGAVYSAFFWLLVSSAAVLLLRFLGLLTPATVFIFMLVYSVADLVCIMFFCPFQVFFLHNRCCTSCRIYNWDFFMMCAPMMLFPHVYSLSLVFLSVAALLQWEAAIFKNPHYFLEETNASLRCESCKDKSRLSCDVKKM